MKLNEAIETIDKLFTPKEYAALKAMPLRTVYDWIEKGKLKTKKIKGQILIMA